VKRRGLLLWWWGLESVLPVKRRNIFFLSFFLAKSKSYLKLQRRFCRNGTICKAVNVCFQVEKSDLKTTRSGQRTSPTTTGAIPSGVGTMPSSLDWINAKPPDSNKADNNSILGTSLIGQSSSSDSTRGTRTSKPQGKFILFRCGIILPYFHVNFYWQFSGDDSGILYLLSDDTKRTSSNQDKSSERKLISDIFGVDTVKVVLMREYLEPFPQRKTNQLENLFQNYGWIKLCSHYSVILLIRGVSSAALRCPFLMNQNFKVIHKLWQSKLYLPNFVWTYSSSSRSPYCVTPIVQRLKSGKFYKKSFISLLF